VLTFKRFRRVKSVKVVRECENVLHFELGWCVHLTLHGVYHVRETLVERVLLGSVRAQHSVLNGLLQPFGTMTRWQAHAPQLVLVASACRVVVFYGGGFEQAECVAFEYVHTGGHEAKAEEAFLFEIKN
jgi:hypothetical protein